MVAIVAAKRVLSGSHGDAEKKASISPWLRTSVRTKLPRQMESRRLLRDLVTLGKHQQLNAFNEARTDERQAGGNSLGR
jgi:hypothetical protein